MHSSKILVQAPNDAIILAMKGSIPVVQGNYYSTQKRKYAHPNCQPIGYMSKDMIIIIFNESSDSNKQKLGLSLMSDIF